MFSFWGRTTRPNRTYLDHAAATPLLPEVAAVMHAVERAYFANPSAIHQEGVAARRVVEDARAKLARCLQVREPDIVFTGSGTESNNLAIIGTIYARHCDGVAYEDMEVITTAIEHPSVLEAVRFLETLGVTVRYVPVTDTGLIDRAAFAELLSPQTVLVSFAYANSEVGVVQPVSALARAVRAYERTHSTRIVVHVDGAQAPLWLSCQPGQLHVDIVTLDAGKCGGPKGVGVLALRHGVTLAPILFGGPQEGGLRPATENVVGIAGAAHAIVVAQAGHQERAECVRQLRDTFMRQLEDIEGLMVNGNRESRLPNNVNVSIPGIDSEFAVIVLDEAGVACSTKSACSGAGGGGSTVVMAMTGDAARANSTIRFTLGPGTTLVELTRTVDVLKTHVAKMLTFKKEVVR